jgi:succinoglycan biosynthesis transport protein ExoP
MTAVPLYTATASLLLDNKRVRAVEEAYEVTSLGFDVSASAVDSQVEVIKSDSVALAVVDKLGVLKDTGVAQYRPSAIALLKAQFWKLFSFGESEAVPLPPPTEEEKRRGMANGLRGGVMVQRVPRTLVLEISYISPDPVTAARIANGFAEAYLVDQLDAKYDAARRASEWLQARMAELKQQVLATDLAIQKFKADNDLISSSGRLMSEQQLTEVNTQLVTARAETARAEARYERIKTIIDGHQTDAVVTEAIGNQIIEQLRSRFVNAVKREAELLAKLGPEHGSVVNLRQEISEYERLMFEELGRLAGVYRSELEIARSREKSLKESLSGLVGTTVAANETLVALRELEREAETYKNLYESFLKRYQEVVQQQSFPITEARVIKHAQKPGGASHPRKYRAIALGIMFGLGIGVCIGALREFKERAFRTADQVRDELGLEFMGMLPMIKPGKEKKAQSKLAIPAILKGGEQAEKAEALSKIPGTMRYVLDHPLSGFAETLRAVKIAMDLTLPDRPVKLIGIVSVLPNEGKSTVSKNLGSLLAHLDTKTLLIDADIRNPSLTVSIAPNAKQGLIEAVIEGKPIKELLLYEPESSLAFLPAVVRTRVTHTSEFIASPGMKSVLKQAAQDFSCILIDLPPLGAVVDVRAVAPHLDAFVLVTEWGKTARALVRTTLESERQVRDKCLGVLLNKVHMRELKLYENYGFKDYYHGRYGNYYSNPGSV